LLYRRECPSWVNAGTGCSGGRFSLCSSIASIVAQDGAFRSLKVISPKGTVVSAVRPAPMRLWMTYPMTVVDTVFKALAPAIPDRVIAGHHADLLTSPFNGINPRNSEFFIANWGPLGGGWGAKRTEDGVSATVCMNDGDTHNSPIEQAEAKYPVLVEHYRLAQDSGGAGRHRGGLGIDRIVRARTPMTVNTQVDRAHCKPWGLEGGREGAGNAVSIRLGGKWKEDFPNAKVLVAQLAGGDAYRMRSGGGGGEPYERPAAAVAEDVRQGYVSLKAAKELYGVVVDAVTFAVDEKGTQRLRERRRSVAKKRKSGARRKTR
jgi:N-methylhydantoinase B